MSLFVPQAEAEEALRRKNGKAEVRTLKFYHTPHPSAYVLNGVPHHRAGTAQRYSKWKLLGLRIRVRNYRGQASKPGCMRL